MTLELALKILAIVEALAPQAIELAKEIASDMNHDSDIADAVAVAKQRFADIVATADQELAEASEPTVIPPAQEVF